MSLGGLNGILAIAPNTAGGAGADFSTVVPINNSLYATSTCSTYNNNPLPDMGFPLGIEIENYCPIFSVVCITDSANKPVYAIRLKGTDIYSFIAVDITGQLHSWGSASQMSLRFFKNKITTLIKCNSFMEAMSRLEGVLADGEKCLEEI